MVDESLLSSADVAAVKALHIPQPTGPTNAIDHIPVNVSVGICAFNEQVLIAEVLNGFLGQRCERARITEIVVLCSGSTDATSAIAHGVAADHAIVTVRAEGPRRGKTAAINELLAISRSEVVLVAGGDTVPGARLVEALADVFADDPRVGMAGPRVMPEPSGGRLSSHLNETLWQLHDLVASAAPKLGEIVAFRSSLVKRLPDGIYCDEVALESLVTAQGGRLAYVRDATVRTYAPNTLRQLYAQRRRIHCQHAASKRLLAYRPATEGLRLVLPAVAHFVLRHPRRVGSVALLGAIESVSRLHGRLDSRRGRRYEVWQPAGRPVRP